MNNEIFFFFYNLAHKSNIFDGIIIFLGIILPFLIFFGVGIFILIESKILNKEDSILVRVKRILYKSIIIFGPAILTFIIATVLKDMIKIDRSFVQFDKVIPLFSPNQEYSFPSSHAATFSALGLSMYFYKKDIGILLLTFALLIGLARIIAGVHFPVDILGGFILGILVSFICRSFSFSVSR
jgi:undecaprenyl-diphosphatase